MPLTYCYAQLFGLIILVFGLAMVVNKRTSLTALQELLGSRMMILLIGLMSLFMGLVVVLTHNVWTGDALTILVTLLGWALLLRAGLTLFLPHGSFKSLIDSFKFEKIYYPVALIALILGIYLTYYGFTGY